MRLNAFVAALAILLFSPAVLALSLGKVEAQSHMNQPLKASITVSAVKYDERDTIRAIIPNAEKFHRSGVRRSDIVENIRLDIVDGASEDELKIILTTEKRITEPFINFLVEVRWLGGSVIREYTLLLDPATIAEARESQGSGDVSTRPLSEPQDTSQPPAFSGSGRSYGPIRRHDTLWSIALSQRSDPSITMDQMQLAIYQANPQAFDGNINRLRTGQMLSIPPDSEIRAIDPSYAKNEVRRQRSNYRPPAPAYTPPPPAPVPEPLPEPEPVVAEEIPEVVPAEPVPEPAEEQAPAAAIEAEVPKEEVATTDGSEPPPDQAASAATAEGEALTQDELIAEGDSAEDDIEMPSVWASEEEAEATQPAPQEKPEATPADAEPVVDAPPEETGFDPFEIVSPVTLLLALLLLVVLLATYWWYRRRRVENVGTQFAYATEEEGGDSDEKKPEAESWAGETEVERENKSTTVWQDDGGVPDSIDEYVSGRDEAPEVPESATPSQPDTTEAEAVVELDAGDASPIRDMSSEEIDYLGEADVHLAYGLYDEAASVLQRGINENPNRDDLRLKLLEVYFSGNLAEEFDAAAEDWRNAGVQDEQSWQKAMQMKEDMGGETEVTGQDAEPDKIATDAVASTVTEEAVEPEQPAEPAESEETRSEKEDEGDLDFDLSGFDVESTADVEPEKTEEEAATTASGVEEKEETEKEEKETESLDFESLDLPEMSPEEEGDDTGKTTADTALEDFETSADSEEDAAEDLDFNLADLSVETESPEVEEDSTAATGVEEDEAGGDLDLGALEIEEPEAAAEEQSIAESEDGAGEPVADEPIADEPAVDSAGDEEVSVKLDLARAYLDMGEPEMAKTLLDEVVDMGNEQQRQEAQDLLSRAAG